MKIYDNNPMMEGSMKRYIQAIIGLDPENLNLSMVNATYGIDSDGRGGNGGAFALSLSSSQLVIIYWFGDQNQFKGDHDFQLALTKSHIYYLDISEMDTLQEIIGQSPKGVAKYVDTLSKIQVERRALESDFSGMLHGCGAEWKDEYKQRVEKVRIKWNLNGTDQEIFNYARTFKSYSPGMYADQEFEGVFCDIEGTLFNNTGEVNEKVKAFLLEKESKGQKIRLWTGGDVDTYTELLKSHEMHWKLFSKLDFSGATVELTVDDNIRDLVEKYNINAKTMIDVKEL